MNVNKNTENIEKSGQLHWYHWLVVISSLILTFCAWYITSEQSKQNIQSQFDYQSEQIIKLVQERMEKYEEALWSGTAAINALENSLNLNQWQAFSHALSIDERFPGINGIGVIHYVAPENLASYLSIERKLRPDYIVHPKHNKNEFWPITYIEPLTTNKKAVGLDIAHEKNRLNAAKKARDTGTAQITGPIILVQDSKKTPGFLFYAPFYRSPLTTNSITEAQEKFIGNVYAPFIMENLMEGTLQNKNRMINFKISDGQYNLYDELHHGSEDHDIAPLYNKITTVEMYGRSWQFTLHSSLLFRQQQSTNEPIFILAGGIIIDTMLFGLFYLLTSANKKAIKLAKEITQDLKNSEERLSTTVENIMDGLITINENDTILTMNSAAEHILGFQAHNVIGSSINILPKPNAVINNEVQKHYLTVSDAKFVNKRRITNALRKNGDNFPIEITINQASNNDEKYFIAVIRDLTLQTKIENSLAEKKALLNAAVHASSAGFAITNINAEFVEVNDSLCCWLDYKREDILNKSFLSILQEKDKKLTQHILNNILTEEKKNVHREILFERSDGNLVWGLLSAAVVRNTQHDISHIVIHITDIQKERELLSDLEIQNIALEKSNTDLNQFAHIASHDLKSPLNAIGKIAGWIHEDCADILPDSSKEHLQLLINRSLRLKKLLDDLLSYSSVGRYQFQTELINLKTIVKNSYELIEQDDNFVISVENIELDIPRVPFELVIRNIISNAIKHHDRAQGRIDITVENSIKYYQIKIQDDGPGIAPNMQSKVVEMFQTLQPRDKVEGSGMGLAMVKKITEYYGAKLLIDSDGKRGTAMIIKWPVQLNESINSKVDG